MCGPKIMPFLVVLLVLCTYFENSLATPSKIRIIHGDDDPPNSVQKFSILEDELQSHQVETRSVSFNSTSTIFPKVNHLKDTHKHIQCQWVGSKVIICLAIDRSVPSGKPIPSAVYLSYDNGDSYENKTDLFKMADTNYATVDKFYVHPKNNTHLIFVDINHKLLYVSNNYGRDIKRIELDFTPSKISFHPQQPSVFAVLDKSDPRRLRVTEDFGGSFREMLSFVRSFYWVQGDDSQSLLVHTQDDTGFTSVLSSKYLFSQGSVSQEHSRGTFPEDIQDIFVKGDYIFTAKSVTFGRSELYVSHKLKKNIKCVFDTELPQKQYYIVDVTGNKALVAVSHSKTTAHLYVSENLNTKDVVKFTLSLEDVFCFFPRGTWGDTWISNATKKAFADIHKVEGLKTIFIATRVISKPERGEKLDPQHLGSVITFDYGRSWRFIKAPTRDFNDEPNNCSVQNDCFLHMSPNFLQLHPGKRSSTILSSKSAPGLILASGTLGDSLHGNSWKTDGVYISEDAGLTWRQTLLPALHFLNMGDHGSILTALRNELLGHLKHMFYSIDNGRNWHQAEFYPENLRVSGFVTEPGENTTSVMIFATPLEKREWVIIKMNLSTVFENRCTKEDYKTWTPSPSNVDRNYISCVLGQKPTFLRRKRFNCYNGEDFDPFVSTVTCGCDIYDFECESGFVHPKKQGSCVRNPAISEDLYQPPSTCKPGQFYKRTKGYRKVQGDVCVDGFENHYMPEEIPCPVETQEFLLFAERGKIHRFDLSTKALTEVPVKLVKNPVAIEFDVKNNCVYWGDNALQMIMQQCLNNNEPEILMYYDLELIEGMALDWISHNLYFTDGKRSTIDLIRTNINVSMRRNILGSPVLRKPRGIAVHPRGGYLFWTDWSEEIPSVSRADLDGSNVRTLFTKPTVVWPNGITIDYIAERIYWVDARLDHIASSDLHGDYLNLIVSQSDKEVSHPFGIAVFKNKIYWDDWNLDSILSTDKDGSQPVEILKKELQRPLDLKVYGHGLQVGTNACTNTSCLFICIPSPQKNKSSCLCPDGMESSNDTCVVSSKSCQTDDFLCANGRCIPTSLKCNNRDDCGDRSDEKDCSNHTCQSNEFACDDTCIPLNWKCDYNRDCSDGSDEKDCPRPSCSEEHQFTCKNEQCIPKTWACDGDTDCLDGYDEMNCTEKSVLDSSTTTTALLQKNSEMAFQVENVAEDSNVGLDGVTKATLVAPPLRLTIDVNGSESAIISWNPPSNGNYSSFKVAINSLNSTPEVKLRNLIATVEETFYLLQELTPGATYQVRVFTVFKDVESVDYASRNFTTKPNIPGKFMILFQNDTTLEGRWQPPSSTGIYTHYKVTIEPPDADDSVLYIERKAAPGRASFNGLEPNKNYNVTVQTMSGGEISEAATAAFKTLRLKDS